MAQYKLFRLFNTLNPAERVAAGQFLSCLNKKHQEDSHKLFLLLHAMNPLEREMPGIKEALFASLFPGEPYNDNKMRKQMTLLTHLLEEFLIQQELSRNESVRQQLLIQSLGRRNDYRLFKDAVKARLNELQRKSQRGAVFFQENQQLYWSLYFHPQTAKIKADNDYLQQYVQYQENYFALASLLARAEILVSKRTISQHGQLVLSEGATTTTTLAKEDASVILFFEEAVSLLKPGKTVDLAILKTQLLQVFGQMAPEEQGMALKLLVFYATPYSNNGHREHSRFIFDLYVLGDECGLLRHGDNEIETNLFLNIAITGALVGELEWTKNFITNYSTLLRKEHRANAVHLCWASWHYQMGLKNGDTGEFLKSLKILNLIPVRSEEIFELRVRSLQLRIQFEIFLAGAEPLETVLKQGRNFKRYLQGNTTFSQVKKEAYLNFILYCCQLARLLNHPERKELDFQIFTEKLQADRHCILKHWLEEKAKVLTRSLH